MKIKIRDLGFSEKRKIYVLDHLFSVNSIKTISEKLRGLPYSFKDFDRTDTKAIKHLKHDFDDNFMVQNPDFLEIGNRAIKCLGKRLIFTGVERIYANFNLHGDLQFSHVDGNGITLLYFSNPSWNPDWLGETHFYSESDESIAVAVSPKPGRIVAFDGRILHRGGTPSKLCFDPRISVAFKLKGRLK